MKYEARSEVKDGRWKDGMGGDGVVWEKNDVGEMKIRKVGREKIEEVKDGKEGEGIMPTWETEGEEGEGKCLGRCEKWEYCAKLRFFILFYFILFICLFFLFLFLSLLFLLFVV